MTRIVASDRVRSAAATPVRRRSSRFTRLALLLLLALVACSSDVAAPATWPFAAEGALEPRQVCFVNDTYMGQPQIPVEVDGKTYYGCCAGCAKVLRGDPTSRQAVDPKSRRTVDKAAAFIAFDPRDGKHVLYFESPASYRAYREGAAGQTAGRG
jgi:YHS domain-containing protein